MDSSQVHHSLTTSSQRIEFIRKYKKIEPLVFPKYCVMGFFPALYGYIKQKYSVQIIDFINPRNPYYLFSRDNHSFSFIFPGIGAPLSGMILDETIALGAEVILIIGSAGSFYPENKNKIFFPTGAVIDEGTSRHYQINDSIVLPDTQLFSAIESYFKEKKIPFVNGLTWTTDTPYRETAEKISQMKKNGCISVEMEASALFSIAKFYRQKTAAFFLPSDYISESSWEFYHLPDRPQRLHPNRLFEYAIDILSNYILENKNTSS